MLPIPTHRYSHVMRARVALEDIARGSRPADQILESLFRSHREMGKRDRAQVSGLVYGVLRDVQRLRVLSGETPADWLARHLADLGLGTDAIAALDLPAACRDGPVPTAAALNLPDNLYARLLAQHGSDQTAALAKSLNRTAPVDLRVNILKTTRESVVSALAAAGIAAVVTPHSPWGLRLAQRLSKQSPLLEQGLIEPQDEGSQLLALLVNAQPGETVIDYCAGAGGKTLALAAAMQDRGRVIACDVLATRLARLDTRLARAPANIVEQQLLDANAEQPLPDWIAKADAVLVDAPCSGTGTLRRAPELRLRHFDFTALAKLQVEILSKAAALVRPGGRLIYASCSLLEEESEQVVADFLITNRQFKATGATANFPSGLLNSSQQLRLWPHRHGTDGFFAALMQRDK